MRLTLCFLWLLGCHNDNTLQIEPVKAKSVAAPAPVGQLCGNKGPATWRDVCWIPESFSFIGQFSSHFRNDNDCYLDVDSAGAIRYQLNDEHGPAEITYAQVDQDRLVNCLKKDGATRVGNLWKTQDESFIVYAEDLVAIAAKEESAKSLTRAIANRRLARPASDRKLFGYVKGKFVYGLGPFKPVKNYPPVQRFMAVDQSSHGSTRTRVIFSFRTAAESRQMAPVIKADLKNKLNANVAAVNVGEPVLH